MRVENTDHLNAPVDHVAELFCSEAFLVTAHAARPEVASARYELLDEAEGRRNIAVRCTQYRRKKTGGLDRKRTDQTAIIYQVDLTTGRAEWHFEGPDADKVSITGATTFEPDHGGTRVIETAHIHVRVPLIGRMIERLIAKGIDGTFDANRGLVRELLESG